MLAQGGRGQVSGRNPLQWLLVGSQVALAVLLLAGAGLLLRSFRELGRVSPGFDSAHVLTFHISGSWNETADYPGLIQRIDRTLDFLRALPGVQERLHRLLPARCSATLRFGRSQDAGRKSRRRTLRSPPRAALFRKDISRPCRFRSSRARHAAETVGVRTIAVNQAFANRYFPDSSPMGHHLRDGRCIGPPGVIEGNRRRRKGDWAWTASPTHRLLGVSTRLAPFPYFLVRTAAAPQVMSETIRRKIFELEPRRSVYDILPSGGTTGRAPSRRIVCARFFCASFAITALLLLACVGLYGTLSYLVNFTGKRSVCGSRWEPCLGRSPDDFLHEAWVFLFLGSIAGLGLSLALTRLLSRHALWRLAIRSGNAVCRCFDYVRSGCAGLYYPVDSGRATGSNRGTSPGIVPVKIVPKRKRGLDKGTRFIRMGIISVMPGCEHKRTEFLMRRDGVDYLRCIDCDQVFDAEDLELLSVDEDVEEEPRRKKAS